jgi:hypothetical protein
MGVFGQEAVTWMDGVDIGDFGGTDDPVDPEVAFIRRGFADANGFIGQLNVHRVGIGLRIDRYRPNIQFLAGPDDANCDLATIGYEEFLEHCCLKKGAV